jgi:hypothetical protein
LSLPAAQRDRAIKYATGIAELRRRENRKLQASEGGLLHFVRHFWHILEPSRPLVEGWALEAICLHLEAVTFGDIKRLLINVPPGFMKSLLVNVFWPAWEWGPMGMPHTRYVAFSYGAHLTERDNAKFRDLVRSPEYKELWGNFVLTKDGEVKVGNDKTGWKFATSVNGIGTGERGDRIIFDDPHNVREAESDVVRQGTVTWFREGMSNRLNDMTTDPIVVIMQRVHENDVSGEIISHPELGYTHLYIPMEFESGRRCVTSLSDGTILWEDPRIDDGELAWEERFPEETLVQFRVLPYMWAGQYQQAPEPRGGGIIKRHYWQYYTPENQMEFGVKPRKVMRKGKEEWLLPFPPFEYVVASLDSAYTEKEENDPNGFTVWGVFNTPDKFDKKTMTMRRGRPQIMLIMAWRKWLHLHGEIVEPQPGESKDSYIERAKPDWGLVEWVAYECRRWNVDRLLIEGKASGLSVAQEMKRLYGNEGFGVEVVNPNDDGSGRKGGNDKTSRLWSVQHLFAEGNIWVPCGNIGDVDNPSWYPRDFAELLIDEMAIYPKGYKDMTDSAVYALKHLRKAEYALRQQEHDVIETDRLLLKKKLDPIY